MSNHWLEYAKKIKSIAQTGLFYNQNEYDRERYQQMLEISYEMISKLTEIEVSKIKDIFVDENGYQTPKVDIRGVVFKKDKILMVREAIDGKWSLPGGWADVGLSPFQVAAKEVQEEAGLEVKPIRVLAIFDKLKHDHPPDIFHTYKIFILCEITGGELKAGMETSDTQFFNADELPELSIERITKFQIHLMFEYLENPDKVVYCD